MLRIVLSDTNMSSGSLKCKSPDLQAKFCGKLRKRSECVEIEVVLDEELFLRIWQL
jgi:hypothetical protein